MNESEKRVEGAKPKFEIIPPTSEELTELVIPGQEYVHSILVADFRVEEPEEFEVDDDEMTLENYEEFLPEYTEANPPNINLMEITVGLLDDEGNLTGEAQAQYDETPPEPQWGYEDSSEGV